MAADHSTWIKLNHRYCEQARSHKGVVARVMSSPQVSSVAVAYTGEIVASTPINKVSAKKPPKKIAIFAMSTPEPKNCSTRAVR